MPRFRRLLRWALLAFAGAAVLGVLALGLLYFLISPKLPDVDALRNVELQEPLYVYARDGRLMALFGETRRYPVEIEKVPAPVKQAFIAIEDARFYQHHGVDYKGVARAVWLIATTDDKRVPGGSTITQQVARQFFLSSEYSYTRKLAEMLLAMRMEHELTKDEIFELYLNKSFFGNRAYGIGAAAEFYYGKTLDQLEPGRDGDAGLDPEVPVQRQSDHQSGARADPPRLRPAADARTGLHRSRPGNRRAGRADARDAARTPGRGAGTLRRGNGAAGNDRALRRRRPDQGLPRHHHHRPDTAGCSRPGGTRWPGRLRPPSWLARRGKAGSKSPQTTTPTPLRAHLRGIPAAGRAACRRW